MEVRRLLHVYIGCPLTYVSIESCWAIHTRDYRIHNPHKCQILVTVPEMLAIMLLSPALARIWTCRIKRWAPCCPANSIALTFVL